MTKLVEKPLNWVVLGSTGQVGRAYTRLLEKERPLDTIHALSRKEADLSQPEQCTRTLERIQPDLVINAGAYTQVDRAETEQELARQINGITPGILAKWCKKRNIPFIHFSTDYVFSGEGNQAWTETDLIQPLNEYGKSKVLGEKAIFQAGGRFLIFRTSWVYDETGNNFVNTMLRLGQEREVLHVVEDQIGAPTNAWDLANISYLCLLKALKMEPFPSGIYHATNQGETNWFEFAKKIFEIAQKYHPSFKVKKIIPITTETYPTFARRPKNSRLKMQKLQDTFLLTFPHWEVSLERCLKEKLNEYHQY